MRRLGVKTKTSKKSITAAQRQAYAMELRLSGASLEEIRDVLGYRGASGVHRAIKAGLDRMLQEPADELRKLEVRRLDKMLKGIWADAVSGKEFKIDRALKIMDRRAKLLGLDAPTKIEQAGNYVVKIIEDEDDTASGSTDIDA